MQSSVMTIHPNEIGGGVALKAFNFGTRKVLAGDKFTRDELLSMRPQNRQALIDKTYLRVYPRPDRELAPIPEGVDRFVCTLGFGRYDVIEGTKVNAEPLSREAAYALAGKDVPVGRDEQKRRQADSN